MENDYQPTPWNRVLFAFEGAFEVAIRDARRYTGLPEDLILNALDGLDTNPSIRRQLAKWLDLKYAALWGEDDPED